MGEDTGPVDAVDGTEVVFCVEGGISEQGFDDVLPDVCMYISYLLKGQNTGNGGT